MITLFDPPTLFDTDNFLSYTKAMSGKYFTYVIWQEGKYFVAQCLNVDVSSFGKGRDEALKNVREAVDLYLEDNHEPNLIDVMVPSITLEPALA